MNSEKLKHLIEQHLPGSLLEVSGDDHTHFYVTIINQCFAGKSLLQRQREVYACVNDLIASGELHALSLKTHTPEEWATIKSTK